MHEIFSKLYTLSKLVIYTFTFRYNLASRASNKSKYSEVCTEWVPNSIFPKAKSFFPNGKSFFTNFIDKYLKFKEIEYFIHYFKFGI